jgi:hypothetical protein
MRKLLSIGVALALLVALPVLAGEAKSAKMEKTMEMKGKITAWNEQSKMFKIEDKTGKVMSFTWNDKTMVHGMPKVDEMVRVEFMRDEAGMMWATNVWVGKEKETKPASQHE